MMIFLEPFINATSQKTHRPRKIKKESFVEHIYDMPVNDDDNEVIYAVEEIDQLSMRSQQNEGDGEGEGEGEGEFNHLVKEAIDKTEEYEEEYNEEDYPEDIFLSHDENNFSTENQSESSKLEPSLKRIKLNYSDAEDEKPRDDIDIFFQSISNSVKQFSPLAQARIKGKIFQIVNEAEIKHHSRIN